MKVQLTDQALVAVVLARRLAEAHGRPATVADLCAGLAAEPDGIAGRAFAAHPGAAERLTTAPRSPRLAPLEVAVGWAAREAAPRPPGTLDLLEAALEVGGSELADLLEASGYDPRVLLPGPPGEGPPAAAAADRLLADLDRSWSWRTETVGFGSDSADLSGDAARAVAQARALGGGAVDLVLAIAAGTDVEQVDPQALAHRLTRLRARGRDRYPGWDTGLDPVLRAARAWRRGACIDAGDLLAAAAAAGGEGPALLLESETDDG